MAELVIALDGTHRPDCRRSTYERPYAPGAAGNLPEYGGRVYLMRCNDQQCTAVLVASLEAFEAAVMAAEEPKPAPRTRAKKPEPVPA